jgi:hypothetical protein
LELIQFIPKTLFYFALSCFVIGTGIAFTHQYRFAAAETVEKNDSSRAISILLLATILSALIGPNVANFTKDIISDHLYSRILYFFSSTDYYTNFFTIFFIEQMKNPKPKENISGNQRSYFELLKKPNYSSGNSYSCICIFNNVIHNDCHSNQHV